MAVKGTVVSFSSSTPGKGGVTGESGRGGVAGEEWQGRSGRGGVARESGRKE